MGCLATWACCGCFANVYSAIGVAHYDGAASAIVSPGSGYTPSQPDGCRNPTSCIPIPRNACASRPEAGARCGNAARRDLCGGCWVTGIPTATITIRSQETMPQAELPGAQVSVLTIFLTFSR